MLKANDPLFPGVEFTIGGDVYIAPSLNLGGIKVVLPRLSGNAAEVLSTVLCVSMKRNYPEVSQPWIDETMTGAEFRQAQPLLMELMRLSGLTEPSAAEPGEDPAAA